MKKLLIFLLLFPTLVWGGNVKNVNGVLDSSVKTTLGVAVAGIKTMNGGDYNDSDTAAPACSDNFNRADAANVLTGAPMWDTEGGEGNLSISGNTLAFVAATDGTSGYVGETTGCITGQLETTIKFKIMFSDIAAISAAGKQVRIAGVHDGTSYLFVFNLEVDASGNLTKAILCRTTADECTDMELTGVAEDTWYNVVLYYKQHDTTGGVSATMGVWSVDTGFNDDTNTATEGAPSALYFGFITNQWGGGTTDATIYFDDLEVYNSDAR